MSTTEPLAAAIAAPRVSIIIPVWNAAPYIAATLHSVSAQDTANVEIIVADGGSTDGTQQIVADLAIPGLRMVSRRDRGQLEALQTGIGLARGDVLMWLNGDDVLMPGAIAAALAAFDADPGIDFVYADSTAFDEPARKFYLAPTIRGLTDWDHLLYYRQLYSECVFWRRSITRLLPEDAYDLRVYTDYAFFLNLRWGRRGQWIPQRLGSFRMRADQNSAAFGARKQAEYRRVRREQCARIGWSPARYRLLRVLYGPWFWPRHVLYPAAERGLRRLWRLLTGDRQRKAMTDWFYTRWLTPSRAE